MRYMSNELLSNNASRMQAYSILRSIGEVLDKEGQNRQDRVIVASYLLYKISTFEGMHDFSLADIFEGALPIKQVVIDYAEYKITEEQWTAILPLASAYSSSELALATYIATTESPISYKYETPNSLVDLAKGILKIGPADSVADICCGVGCFLSSVALDNPNQKLAGYDVNAECVAIASIKSDLLGADIYTEYRNAFGLLDSEDGKMQKYSKLFANYPFKLGLQRIGDGNWIKELLKQKYDWINNSTSSDWLFNALLCELMDEDGMAVAIMTKGALLNKADTAAREYFICSRLVRAVILLPDNMIGGTSVSTAMIVLKKNPGYIRMIDARAKYQAGRRINEFSEDDIKSIVNDVHPEPIMEEDPYYFTGGSQYAECIDWTHFNPENWFLSPDRYMNDGNYHGFEEIPFDTVIKKISRGAPCTAKELDEMSSSEPTNIQYLTTSSIQDGVITGVMPYLKELKPQYRRYCIKNNNLIVSKNAPFKFAVADIEEGKTVLANGNVYIIELDEAQINPYFLQAYFNDNWGLKSLQNISIGTTVSSLNVDDIRNLVIPVPALEKQEAIAKAYKAKLDEISLLKLKLDRAREELTSVFIDNVETIYAVES